MKKIALATCLLISMNATLAQTWDDHPSNWNNSQYNWDNSSSNWNNSQHNWDNSPMNSNSNNGIFDNNGNRIGYSTQSPKGVTNIYDTNGNRIGYRPR